ncbi:protein DDI1 homolog 2 [Octopus bimaculoides]|uniref:UBA domain-containing protein n=1 Tax=Octopus bimaculoides TaxID=37653 RepID=A0A0L8HWI7_OCTBM|nr:protein DDI1 homolog 2 [Octopus bimaculoides]XP_014769084.1 protein DDI1 homolog 2 [Octopus bimaculoides]XP_052832910.1 protein DDI1 homolog 2 [Octopus bimaculoides]|eukprot:XP_014769083.1 PREDICTED: protein DDI1 homolog 2-like [Octopus bimaculoides]
MQVTVTTLSDKVFTIEVSEDLELENFKALCEFETGIPAKETAILLNGRPLRDDKASLKSYGIGHNDILLLQHMRGVTGLTLPTNTPFSANTSQRSPAHGGPGSAPVIDFGSIQIPGVGPLPQASIGGQSTSQGHGGGASFMDDPKVVRDMFLNNPHELALLKERNPPLAEALVSGSLEKFSEVFRQQQSERMEKAQERMRLMSANPFSPEVQKMIAEEIRLKNVETNMETAMEFAPESFGQVHMLYIDCNVNGHPVKAFVDSGAQMTIMSQSCAERCNIMRLVDNRWAGIAKGVGTQKIIGRVHLGQIQIGPDFLQSSFSILEDQPVDMLLGLDMLRRHQCSIDLKRNVLVIGTTGTETPFLSESELPEHARLNLLQRPSSSIESEDQQLAEALARSAEEASAKHVMVSSRKLTSTSTAISGSKPTATVSSPPHIPPTSPPQTFSEEAMLRLMSYGFERQQVLDELHRSNGDVDQALAALLAKSLQMP